MPKMYTLLVQGPMKTKIQNRIQNTRTQRLAQDTLGDGISHSRIPPISPIKSKKADKSQKTCHKQHYKGKASPSPPKTILQNSFRGG